MGLALLQSIGIGFVAFVIVVVVVIYGLISAVKIIKEYERGVIFRLGRVQGDRRDRGSSCSSH